MIESDFEPVEEAPAEEDAAEEGPRGPEYQVGYARPPVSTRFQPGQTGNPKGRPKKNESHAAIVKRVLNEPIKIKENGRLKRVTKQEALIRTNLANALQGDVRAVREAFSQARDAGMTVAESDVGTQTEHLVDDDREIMERYGRK
ncbi:DUF5681 domain-containing protein [Mesorhizobium yinganensis]|uniref:DUF5681 domain-containing protein n=1 Tax=Mesorhizobium yinganensis TaxID=3157707 RepID=UPI0032B7867C